MKKYIIAIIASLVFVSMSIASYSQEYSAEVFYAGGVFVKDAMGFSITDSTIVMKHSSGTTELERLVSAPGTIYYTDGVIKYSLFVMPDKGKVKGFRYTHTITNTNLNSNISIVWYAVSGYPATTQH